MKKIASLLLIITLLVVAVAMTSCNGDSHVVDSLLTDVPEGENGYGDSMHWLGDHFDTMINNFLSFEWLNAAIEWCDNTFEITKSLNLLEYAFGLIQEGDPANTLEVFGIVFGRISILFFAFIAGVVILAATLAVEIIADVIIGIIIVLLIIAITVLAGIYFVYQFIA